MRRNAQDIYTTNRGTWCTIYVRPSFPALVKRSLNRPRVRVDKHENAQLHNTANAINSGGSYTFVTAQQPPTCRACPEERKYKSDPFQRLSSRIRVLLLLERAQLPRRCNAASFIFYFYRALGERGTPSCRYLPTLLNWLSVQRNLQQTQPPRDSNRTAEIRWQFLRSFGFLCRQRFCHR